MSSSCCCHTRRHNFFLNFQPSLFGTRTINYVPSSKFPTHYTSLVPLKIIRDIFDETRFILAGFMFSKRGESIGHTSYDLSASLNFCAYGEGCFQCPHFPGNWTFKPFYIAPGSFFFVMLMVRVQYCSLKMKRLTITQYSTCKILKRKLTCQQLKRVGRRRIADRIVLLKGF